MKRLILLIMLILLMSGCININDSTYDEIIKEAVTSNTKVYNTYRKGYKFYLPDDLYVVSNKGYNEILKSNDVYYYLYIDVIGYLSKSELKYEEKENSYYSKVIKYENKIGYIEINQKNDKYLVEIMYNYAKIEVMIDRKDIKSAICKSIIVLSSIYYNDGILSNLSENNLLNYNEEEVDIFSSVSVENSNFLEQIEEDEYEDEGDIVPDYDVIN